MDFQEVIISEHIGKGRQWVQLAKDAAEQFVAFLVAIGDGLGFWVELNYGDVKTLKYIVDTLLDAQAAADVRFGVASAVIEHFHAQQKTS